MFRLLIVACIAGKNSLLLAEDVLFVLTIFFNPSLKFRAYNLSLLFISGVSFAEVGPISNPGIAKTPNRPVFLLVKDEIGDSLEPSLPGKFAKCPGFYGKQKYKIKFRQ